MWTRAIFDRFLNTMEARGAIAASEAGVLRTRVAIAFTGCSVLGGQQVQRFFVATIDFEKNSKVTRSRTQRKKMCEQLHRLSGRSVPRRSGHSAIVFFLRVRPRRARIFFYNKKYSDAVGVFLYSRFKFL